jgi:phage terminase small subunit
MNDKQRRFAEEYCVDLNATQAAIRAGYSAKTAYSQGQRLLKDVEVAESIAAQQVERSERLQVSVDDVVRGLHREATDLATGTPAARVSAWGLLGKHLGMFVERHEHTGTIRAIYEVEVPETEGDDGSH